MEGMILVARIRDGIADHFPVRVAEWQNALALFAIGLWLLNPLLITFQGPSYMPLLALAREAVWGFICITIGGGRVVALTINGSLNPNTKTPYVRAGFAFLACGIWFLFGVGIASTANPGLGVVIYPIMFAVDTYNVFRATSDARAVYEARKTHAAYA